MSVFSYHTNVLLHSHSLRCALTLDYSHLPTLHCVRGVAPNAQYHLKLHRATLSPNVLGWERDISSHHLLRLLAFFGFAGTQVVKEPSTLFRTLFLHWSQTLVWLRADGGSTAICAVELGWCRACISFQIIHDDELLTLPVIHSFFVCHCTPLVL